jgi:hypothetical protein
VRGEKVVLNSNCIREEKGFDSTKYYFGIINSLNGVYLQGRKVVL